ncbi:pentapeptide repeat-containing protein [Streptomyces luomodiensis]|uniref:Pentapeptide repeat-containing protein n=1 Tax=Streptomyces luomodiensis TaxID=3026192 RepID=A0ABY9VBP5_9ACTN|nr:pentapeptide repeat-containing protein [Streptomyces sp. SCA4-21]WNF01416.1 pentapeptide repeat-containing protein [Streptomyces sp. SCA4-21]
MLSLWALLAQTDGLRGADRAKARMDAVKAALTVGAGTGGAAALLLTARRQWLNEREQIHREAVDASTEQDATERRITELYTAAAAQLGSESAPVRLAGIYALERLAQDHPDHRQTIVDVMCAYLRMPFNPAPPAEDEGRTGWKQEKVVRATVQKLLADHLRVDPKVSDSRSPGHSRITFWPDIQLNLSGATLIDVDFTYCRIQHADFRYTHFAGTTNFAHAEIVERGFFHGTTFEHAIFRGVWFGQFILFDATNFRGIADFEGATFAGYARWGRCSFAQPPSFREARALTTETEWTTNRQPFPSGWKERPLAEGEPLPEPERGRRTWSAHPLPENPRWALVVQDGTPDRTDADGAPA